MGSCVLTRESLWEGISSQGSMCDRVRSQGVCVGRCQLPGSVFVGRGLIPRDCVWEGVSSQGLYVGRYKFSGRMCGNV